MYIHPLIVWQTLKQDLTGKPERSLGSCHLFISLIKFNKLETYCIPLNACHARLKIESKGTLKGMLGFLHAELAIL